MGENVPGGLRVPAPPTTGGYRDEGPKESNIQSSDLATSDALKVNPSRDWDTSSNFESVPSDATYMSDSSSLRHAKPRHSRTRRRSASHLSQPSTTHVHSLPPSPQVPFENTQRPTNFPSLHYSASPPPGGVYIGQYTMSPQPPSMHSPNPYGFWNTYHHPIMSDSSSFPPNFHSPYSQQPHTGPVYQHQPHSREGNAALHLSFSGTGPPAPYPPRPIETSTPPTAQNSPHSPSYIGSGVFHSLQHSSPISTPHYPYSPPFPGTPTYQPQYPHPPPQFGQYDAGPFYSGHYPTAYPPTFSSASSSTPYPPLSQHSEISSKMRHSHAASSEHLPSDKPIIRQPYHPNPPPDRSEWVMWAGNIPSDATHNEIYQFFSQAPENRAFEPGVVSVFLISRSNCAFVNFESQDCLLKAISRFNGVPLRADDPRCARLVCRVRHKDDDLKAGVGGQRGTGMHARWVKDQQQRAQEKPNQDQSDLSVSDRRSTSSSSVSEPPGYGISNFSSDNSEVEQNVKHSSTSDSYSSSNSSFLARHFPKRYFILKSSTQHDLDLSVQTGFWATQKHNEGILDQSYRTSKDVYLIFGANKSGEFYGYARMAGPVRRGGQSITWATSPPRSNQSPRSSRLSSQPSASLFFSPGDHRLVDSSPLSVGGLHTKTPHPGQQGPLHNQSAPGMLGRQYDLPSTKTPEIKYSLDHQQRQLKAKNLPPPPPQKDGFELDPSAPVRAMRPTAGKKSSPTPLHPLEKVEERAEEPDSNVQESSHQQEEKGEDLWGDCFAVEWISTQKLPFNRTRQLRNPWNHDREVKVSRDGTELEPTVGQKLLDEWHKLSGPQEPLTFEGGVGEGGHEGGSKSAGSSSKRLGPR